MSTAFRSNCYLLYGPMVTYGTGYEEEVTPSGKLSKEYLERVYGNTGCPVWIPRTI